MSCSWLKKAMYSTYHSKSNTYELLMGASFPIQLEPIQPGGRIGFFCICLAGSSLWETPPPKQKSYPAERQVAFLLEYTARLLLIEKPYQPEVIGIFRMRCSCLPPSNAVSRKTLVMS